MSKSTNFRGTSETVDRTLTMVLMWGCWLAVIAMGVFATFNYDPNKGDFPPSWYNLAFLMLLGVGIAAGNRRNTQKQGDKLTDIFTAGMVANAEQNAELKEQIGGMGVQPPATDPDPAPQYPKGVAVK